MEKNIFWNIGQASNKLHVDIRKNIVDLSKQDMENADTTREVARNLLSTWQLNSSFFRAAMGPQLKELPASIVDSMDELDKLAAIPQEQWTDDVLGRSVGLRVRIMGAVVSDTLKKFVPKVLEFIPTGLLW